MDVPGSSRVNPSRYVLLVTAGAAALTTATVSGQRSANVEILSRASAYVTEFVERFSSIVAEERYVQDSKPIPGSRPRGTSSRSAVNVSAVPRHVELKSDYLLVKPQSSGPWYSFRDVFEVNGAPVRDREERLTTLFLQPTATALEDAERIALEAARYNMAAERTLNNPLLAIAFLQAVYQPRFRFSVHGIDKEAGPDVFIVEYKEQARPTLLRIKPDGDLPARGRYWIEGSTGRVVKTELSTGRSDTVVTTFRYDSRLQIAVPVEMREEFWLKNESVIGVAVYDRFRQFNVRTEEKFR